MKDIHDILKSTINRVCGLFFFSLVALFLFSSEVHAQFPLTQRGLSWDGPYDIRSIASANLDPVFINPTQAASGKLLADSLVTTEVMRRTGSLGFHMNNEYAQASPSPFTLISSIPKSAFLCKGDPNVGGCLKGLLTQSTSSSCPVVKYNGPDLINSLVSMTYADYDGDNSTFSSSMAQLDISSCSQIESAYLYWTGNLTATNPSITLLDGPLNSYTGGANVFNVTSTNINKVKFKIPGSSTYQIVTAAPADILILGGNRYRSVADVTSIVKGTGGGQFWVADLPSYPDANHSTYGGSASGWTLIVVFKSPLSPPRRISLFDGLDNISSGSKSYTLNGIVAPNTGSFKSYVGYGCLDAENNYSEIIGKTGNQIPPGASGQQEGLRIQTSGGGPTTDVIFNPFQTDQPPYKLYNKKGYPAQCDGSDNLDPCKTPLFDGNWCSVYDGISSSHITSYNETTGKNGNEITRLPTNVNTLGYDSHHLRLPNGSVAPGATQAILSISSGAQGGVSPFFAYIAIERLQPKLIMTKTANKDVTNISGSPQITYNLTIKNIGNDASLGGDIIHDSLDAVTNLVPGSYVTKINNTTAATASVITILPSPNDTLILKVLPSIPAGDSIQIAFTVDVLTNPALYSPPACKRTIQNTAYIDYNTVANGILQSKSNANDCGIGAETKVLVIDNVNLPAATHVNMGPFPSCALATSSIVAEVQNQLIAATATTGATASNIADYDIRDNLNARVQPADVFGTAGGSVSYFAYLDVVSGTCQKVFELVFTCTPSCPTGVISGSTAICADGVSTATITATLTGKAPWTYIYAIDGVDQPVSAATSLATNTFQSSTGAHTYTLTSVFDANFPAPSTCTGNVSGSAVITTKPAPLITSDATDSVCSGVSHTYDITSNVVTTYKWDRAVVTGISNSAKTNQSSDPIVESLTNTTTAPIIVTYIITPAAAAGCPGTPFNYKVTVFPKATVTTATTGNLCSGTAQNFDLTSNVSTATFTWDRAAVTGITEAAVSSQTADPITEVLTNTTASAKTVSYVITPMVGGCAGTPLTYKVTVNPIPVVNSGATGTICSNVAQSYDIASNVSTATFTWGRLAVSNISNAAVAGQTADPITETLVNTSSSPVVVRYTIVPTAAGCTGTTFNYDVTVNPIPVINTAATNTGICSGTAQNYTIGSNIAATYSWSRAAVTGISNAAATAQTSNPISEALNNTGASALTVTYLITPTASGCTGATFSYAVTVNPTPTVNSAATNSGICSGIAQNYDITSNISTATFTWNRAAVAGISNAAASAQTADPITETLVNTGTTPLVVRYVITPIDNSGTTSCPGIAFNYDVTVNPIPVVNSAATGTVCSNIAQGYDITSNVSTATFSWSRTAVANISNVAASGQTTDPIVEKLINTGTSPVIVQYVIIPSVGGCAGNSFNYDVTVNPSTVITTQPAAANLCAGNPLNLSVASTGLTPTYQWMLNGAPAPGGTNSSSYTVASSGTANAGQYTVVITSGCPTVTSNAATVAVTTPPINTQAVSSSNICENKPATVIINGAEGSGISYEAFIGATSVSPVTIGNGGNLPLSINASALVPGSHTITVMAYGCDTLQFVNSATINVTAMPVANAGADIIVDDFGTVTLDGSNSSMGPAYVYQWTSSDPDAIITLPTAISTTAETQLIRTDFILTVTDINNTNCNVSDPMTVSLIPKPVIIPNSFSPNGDGIHDLFEIQNMKFFSKAILYVYNQWGELIYKSDPGYKKFWDGKRNGSPVPVSAYYYVLELNETGFKSLSGDITIVK